MITPQLDVRDLTSQVIQEAKLETFPTWTMFEVLRDYGIGYKPSNF
jgi:hypothetical protein